MAERYAISKNHLGKVIQMLAAHGYVHSVRGRNGGIRAGRDPRLVSVGEVVRLSEENFNLVECFDRQANACVITPVCRLRGVLSTARDAFLRELDAVTIADLTASPAPLRALLFAPPIRLTRRPRSRRSAAG